MPASQNRGFANIAAAQVQHDVVKRSRHCGNLSFFPHFPARRQRRLRISIVSGSAPRLLRIGHSGAQAGRPNQDRAGPCRSIVSAPDAWRSEHSAGVHTQAP